ncbi:MAG: hypothetical protein LBS16_05740 [Prevotellaceae bacterium]|nr:hypothetical protein [Prevotellaceae bacterium]
MRPKIAVQKLTPAPQKYNFFPNLQKNECPVIFFTINSKNGRDISKISELNGIFAPENQKEVLFKNNTPFKITGKEVYPDGVVVLKLEEL